MGQRRTWATRSTRDVLRTVETARKRMKDLAAPSVKMRRRTKGKRKVGDRIFRICRINKIRPPKKAMAKRDEPSNKGSQRWEASSRAILIWRVVNSNSSRNPQSPAEATRQLGVK